MKSGRIAFSLAIILVICTLVLQAGAAPKITLRIMDNISDRNSPWGLTIEEINAEFKAKHPDVEIATESLPDQPYQQKMKIYAASKQLPDVFKYWSFSTLLGELVGAGLVLELDKNEYADMGFVPGSLEANTYDGKLYGLPTNTDFWLIYYNKALFKQCNVSVPETFEDLLGAAKVFRSKGIIPMTTDGKDGWPLSLTMDNLIGRCGGDFSVIQKALDRKMKFTAPVFVAAARRFKEMVNAGVFQDDLLTSDYGAARNLFGQEKAAMYLMGSWEMGLSTDNAFSAHFRENVSAMKFPVLKDGKGGVDDLVAWFGGNYCINAKTKYKDLCLDYLKIYFTLHPKLTWQRKAVVPAQRVETRPDDNELSKGLLAILSSAKQTSGTGCLDRSTPEFKELHQKYCQELAAGIKTPEQFVEALDVAAEKAAGKS